MIRFERSTDYELIREILTEPRCWRRMTGSRSRESGAKSQEPGAFQVGPLEGIEYVLARFDCAPAAVFLIEGRAALHFCFVPAFWGRSEAVARGFIEWLWQNTTAGLYKGHVPEHNRLALQLAKRVGFTEKKTEGGSQESGDGRLIVLEIERPC